MFFLEADVSVSEAPAAAALKAKPSVPTFGWLRAGPYGPSVRTALPLVRLVLHDWSYTLGLTRLVQQLWGAQFNVLSYRRCAPSATVSVSVSEAPAFMRFYVEVSCILPGYVPA